MQQKLTGFLNRIKGDVTFTSGDYKDCLIPRNSFVYIDPPYLISTATYNEQGGWTNQHEVELYKYLDELTKQGTKWAMSNVFEVNGRTNEGLVEYSSAYTTHDLTFGYGNSSYQKKEPLSKTREVLVCNY